MRRPAPIVLVLAAALALGGALAAPGAAEPEPTVEGLSEARAERARARAELELLEARLGEARRRAVQLERRIGRVTLRLLAARRAEALAAERLDAAQDQLRLRAQAAYELGPGGALELLLSADSMGDLVAMRDFADAAVGADSEVVAEAAQARAELDASRAAVAAIREPLVRQEAALRDLLARLQLDTAQARAAAERAGLRARELEQAQRELEEALERAEERDQIIGGEEIAGGVDQSELLALLGPNQGRGCEIPDTLRDTGKRLAGLATWYGWEFAGQPTASGALFDPRLFTAAHRTLPLGSFLRIRYEGRCAIVLVNDRGPYGDTSRIIDLSQAAATYLGVGVSRVRADVLVPA